MTKCHDPACRCKRHSGVVPSLHVTANGKELLTIGEEEAVRSWRLETGDNLGANSAIKTMLSALSPDERTLAIGGHQGRLGLWDVEQRKFLFMIPGHTKYIYSVAFSADGRFLVYGGGSGDVGELRIWPAAD